MISKHKFLKESKRFRISESDAGLLYDSFEKMFNVVKGKHLCWSKLSAEEWNKILEIEEILQWSVLKNFSSPMHEIYRDVDEKKKGDAIRFQKSIQDEATLRKNRISIGKNDYLLARKLLIEQRFDYFLTIFEVNKRQLWKLIAKITLTSGAIVGATYAYKKYKSKKNGQADKE